MSITVTPYTPDDEARWDTFCHLADNATFLHTRKFLSYHADRFIDQSLLIYEDDRLIGVLAAAVSPVDQRHVVSHPGLTYGGILHQGRLAGNRMLEALEMILSWYRKCGFSDFVYKALPYIYAIVPSQDDLYALFRMGAVRTRCDLSSAIDIVSRRTPSERRRRSLKKGLKLVQIVQGMEQLPVFWDVLAENLRRKHQVTPVHSLQELELLTHMFPKQIQLWTAMRGDEVLAGVLVFCCPNVWHAQYIASSPTGYEVCALDSLFESIIEQANSQGVRYFDFGTSTESAGTVLNEGLYHFKSGFGGGGVVHEFYTVSL